MFRSCSFRIIKLVETSFMPNLTLPYPLSLPLPSITAFHFSFSFPFIQFSFPRSVLVSKTLFRLFFSSSSLSSLPVSIPLFLHQFPPLSALLPPAFLPIFHLFLPFSSFLHSFSSISFVNPFNFPPICSSFPFPPSSASSLLSFPQSTSPFPLFSLPILCYSHTHFPTPPPLPTITTTTS